MAYGSAADRKRQEEQWQYVRTGTPPKKKEEPKKPARTKADTIGTGAGGVTRPRGGGTAKPKPTAGRPTSRFAGARDANFNAIRNGERDGKPAATSSPRPTAVTSGGSTPASRPVSGGGGAAKTTPSSGGGGGGGGTSKIHTYKEHGSDLHVGRYKTLAEHRAAVEKAKGGGSTPAKDTPSTSGVGPVADGKQYAADKEREDKKGRTSGVGPVASGSEYGRNLKPSGGQPQVDFKPQTKVDGSKYEAKGNSKNFDTKSDIASKASHNYLTELEKKRKGQSNVIG